MRRWRGFFAMAIGIVSITLAGCSISNDSKAPTPPPDSPSAAPTPTPSESMAESSGKTPDNPAEMTAAPADVKWEMGQSQLLPGDRSFLLTHDFRVGLHDDFYRVIVEFDGEGEPGWRSAWVDKAYEIGRGDELPIPPGHVLDINITGTTMPIFEGQPEIYYNGPADKRIDDHVIAWFDAAFEGQTHLAISSDIERPYRIFTLESPTRVVIDLQR
ncbi:MAG: hypothetical protein Q4P05_00925 [Actinomycetaceae bacterium]|nr:hypothetical protein [Actinomycetaceae bacterium]